jgi:hypothetical protein
MKIRNAGTDGITGNLGVAPLDRKRNRCTPENTEVVAVVRLLPEVFGIDYQVFPERLLEASVKFIAPGRSQRGSDARISLNAGHDRIHDGIDIITQVLAKELGPKKIRVNSINPGGTETEGAHALGVMGSEFEKHIISQTPLGRFGQPEDIAPVAVFLSSEASYWITGEILLASGGMR